MRIHRHTEPRSIQAAASAHPQLADSLLICEDEQTFAATQPRFIAAPDFSNTADFLHICHWKAEDVQSELRRLFWWRVVSLELPLDSKHLVDSE